MTVITHSIVNWPFFDLLIFLVFNLLSLSFFVLLSKFFLGKLKIDGFAKILIIPLLLILIFLVDSFVFVFFIFGLLSGIIFLIPQTSIFNILIYLIFLTVILWSLKYISKVILENISKIGSNFNILLVSFMFIVSKLVAFVLTQGNVSIQKFVTVAQIFTEIFKIFPDPNHIFGSYLTITILFVLFILFVAILLFLNKKYFLVTKRKSLLSSAFFGVLLLLISGILTYLIFIFVISLHNYISYQLTGNKAFYITYGLILAFSIVFFSNYSSKLGFKK